MALTISPARSDGDIDAVRKLCREFERAMRLRYSDQVWLLESYFEPERWFEELRDIGKLYAAPAGEILLARIDDMPVGCVMMRKLEDGVCEMKRLFVTEKARGQQAGSRLCESLIALAKERGYKFMRLDTGFKQPEARQLYDKFGFVSIPAYYQLPTPVADLLDFMQLAL
ncbi:MAG: GNAT family N-acetyltransferase [Pseudomonadota bacterium]|nr:GNAT family N-acetyltransferase [Pseudomonadota bacterium]